MIISTEDGLWLQTFAKQVENGSGIVLVDFYATYV
jgi:hypothetical protein